MLGLKTKHSKLTKSIHSTQLQPLHHTHVINDRTTLEAIFTKLKLCTSTSHNVVSILQVAVLDNDQLDIAQPSKTQNTLFGYILTAPLLGVLDQQDRITKNG